MVAIRGKGLGVGDPDTLKSMSDLGEVLFREGKYAHSEARECQGLMQAAEKARQSEISRTVHLFSAPTVVIGLDDNPRVIRKSVA